MDGLGLWMKWDLWGSCEVKKGKSEWRESRFMLCMSFCLQVNISIWFFVSAPFVLECIIIIIFVMVWVVVIKFSVGPKAMTLVSKMSPCQHRCDVLCAATTSHGYNIIRLSLISDHYILIIRYCIDVSKSKPMSELPYLIVEYWPELLLYCITF